MTDEERKALAQHIRQQLATRRQGGVRLTRTTAEELAQWLDQ